MFDHFKQLKAKVNDTEINFKIRNIHKSCENAILFLHGFPQTHAMWAGIADQFADDYPIICPDYVDMVIQKNLWVSKILLSGTWLKIN